MRDAGEEGQGQCLLSNLRSLGDGRSSPPPSEVLGWGKSEASALAGDDPGPDPTPPARGVSPPRQQQGWGRWTIRDLPSASGAPGSPETHPRRSLESRFLLKKESQIQGTPGIAQDPRGPALVSISHHPREGQARASHSLFRGMALVTPAAGRGMQVAGASFSPLCLGMKMLSK